MEQGNQRHEFRADEHHPLPGRRVFPAGPDRTYQAHLEPLPQGTRRGARQQRRPLAGQRHRLDHHLAQGGLYRQGTGADRGLADRRAAQAGHQALRRHQRRIARLQGERRGRGREGQGYFHPLPQDA